MLQSQYFVLSESGHSKMAMPLWITNAFYFNTDSVYIKIVYIFIKWTN